MSIIGGLLLVIAIVVVCVRQFSTQKELDKMLASDREKIGEVLSVQKQVKEELETSENSVAKQLTVMGTPSCDEPLISPLGNKPCLYYSMKVTSKRIEHYTEKDSEGRTVNKTRTIEDVLDQSTNCTRFKIDDGTGSVMVDPHDGSFEGTTTSVNKSETHSHKEGANASISFGNFSLNLSNRNYSSSPTEPETIKYEEEIMGFDRPLTVIGTLTDKMGDFVIEKCGKNSMIVSTKSQDDMIAERKSALKTQLIIAAVCGGLGLIFLIIGLF